MVKISVIIPVYNVEKYLEECLNSIVNQTLDDIEIICINDGSSDDSLNILNNYAFNDKRIKVISQQNAGCGAASNLGMSIASGEYLYFMDSDDVINPNAFKELYEYIKFKNADFVIFQAINYNSDDDEYFKSRFYSMEDVVNFVGDSLFDYEDLGELIFSIAVPPWNKIFNHKFIKENNIKFPEGLIFEDNIFFWDVLFNAKKIAIYNKYFYIRRRHNHSVMSSKDYRYIDSIKVNNLMIKKFKEYGVFNKFKKILYNRKINLNYVRFCDINPEFKEDYFDILHEDYVNILNSGFYDDYAEVLDSRNKAIFDICLNAKTVNEFKFEMAYWDSQVSRKKQSEYIAELESKVEHMAELESKVGHMGELESKIECMNDELMLFKKWMLSGFMIKVSVVIPVYNVEEFLKECLDSIVNQTLKEIEIICINDGSTDASLDILNYYALNDERFTIISQKNAGHAVATNRGMKLAKGKYLYLMDSDDILELTALEETYNYAEEKNVDFVLFKSMNYITDEDRYYKTEIYSMDRVANFAKDKVFNYKDLGDLIFAIPVTPWSKLYRNEFIKKIDAKFPEGLVFDDNIFFWDVLFNAKKIAFYHKYLFIRRWYSYSSTTSGDARFLDSIDINNLMIDKFKQYGEFEKYKTYLYNRKINMALNRFNGIKPEFKEAYFNKLQDDLKNIISQGAYEDYMEILDERNKEIFNSCINSNTSKEFQFEIAYWDSLQTRKKQEIQIDNLNNALNQEKLRFNQAQSNYKKEIKDLKDKNYSLVGNNTILKNQINYYSSSTSWKMTKPLRYLQKLSSNEIMDGNGNISLELSKFYFNEDELIRLCNIGLNDKLGNEINIDFNKLNVIYDKSFMIPFKNLVKSDKFEGCYEFPAFVLGRGQHQICLNYDNIYSKKFSVFIKDNHNLFDFNVWSGTDFAGDTSNFDKFNLESIESSDYWSDIGKKSIKVVCNGKNDYQALVTPVQNVESNDFISASVTIHNPNDEVTVRLFERDNSSYNDVIVSASAEPKNIHITKSVLTKHVQLLIISRVKQIFYADNFVIKIN